MSGHNRKPPRLAAWIFRRCAPGDAASMADDLELEYAGIVKDNGRFHAGLWITLQTVTTVAAFLLHSIYWSFAMLKNYLKTAFRNLRSNKLSTGINVISLSVAFACGILIFSFVRDEYSFDRFHEDADAIFEIYQEAYQGEDYMWTGPQAALCPTLPDQFPDISAAVRVTKKNFVVKQDDALFTERFVCTEPAFFDVFTFPLKPGSGGVPVLDVNSLIVSQGIADKYFGDDNPLGRRLSVRIDGEFLDFTVTGVLDEYPGNSSLRPEMIIHLRNTHGGRLNSWSVWGGPGVFVRLRSAADASDLARMFPETIDRHLHENGLSEMSGYRLSSLTAYHFDGVFSSELSNGSSRIYSYVLSGIALLVLIIAVSNFVNITIGGSAGRLKEIGLRKVFGAHRKQLVRQFWFESIIIGMIAAAAGMLIAALLLPPFNLISQKSLSLGYMFGMNYLIALIGMIVLIGVLAGSYPAMVLSGFSPLDLFRKVFRFSGKNLFSRSAIVLQFAISIFFMIATLLIFEQYEYMLGTKFGIDSEHVVVLDLREGAAVSMKNRTILTALRNSLLQDPSVQSISASLSKYDMFSATFLKDRNGQMQVAGLNWIDYDYFDLFGIDVIEGRNFSRDRPSDRDKAVVVNETFQRRFDVADPTGKKLSDFCHVAGSLDGEIIGVVEDFHNTTLHHEIWPTFFKVSENEGYKYVYVKISGENIRRTMQSIETEFKAVAPNIPFIYSFIDDEIAQKYVTEKRYGKMFGLLSFFSVLIACSGLFGLTSFIVARRTKEISIRKVLGASAPGLIQMLNREFLILVGIANIIAWPAAFFAANEWLQNFAYSIDMSPVSFVASGFLVLVIAVITVTLQSGRAVLSNPVDSLRNE